MTNRSRTILTCMALLDAVCLGRFLESVSFDYLRYHILSWYTFLHSIHILFLGSLAISAYGLAMTRSWAMWVSYFQLPARAIHITLSFGWLALAARFLGNEAYRPLLFIAIGLEVLRAALTVVIHRRMHIARRPDAIGTDPPR